EGKSVGLPRDCFGTEPALSAAEGCLAMTPTADRPTARDPPHHAARTPPTENPASIPYDASAS
ncbi:MAG TPA: hypothetical protein VFS51_10270, partial [Gemmatimonadales bacterium]|nr:hypothetical protein [Gemmatimonadales bacterium]